MEDSRAILAIGRIERAMSRIERSSRDGGHLAAARERHDALRAAMEAAVADIDRLVEAP